MGYATAVDFASNANVNQAVSWHLAANIYPPAPQYMVRPCIDAINAILCEDYDAMIELPQGVVDRDGNDYVTAQYIANSFRLEGIIDGIQYDLYAYNPEEEGL